MAWIFPLLRSRSSAPAFSLPQYYMDNKYKIVMQCYNADRADSYPDEVTGDFENETQAKYEMLYCVIDELSCLNGILGDGTFPELRFIATMEDEDHDVIINAWDGTDYRPVTCYDVITVENHLHALNSQLRKTHGEEVTVEVKAYIEDDDSVNYYYTSARLGDSKSFSRAVDAWSAADDYLRCLSDS